MTARFKHPDVDGYAVVTGTKGRLVLLDVFSKDGGFLYEDRATFNPRTKGPDGWTLEGESAPKPRTKHEWGPPVEVGPNQYGNRCRCGWERKDFSSGANYQFRRPGEPWRKLARVPPCEGPK